MRRLQILGSMILIGALGVPVMGVAQQDRDRDRDRTRTAADRDHDRDDQGRRVYDPYRKDYHNWDADEQRYYGQWAREHRYEGREYGQLKAREQKEYWKWRHQHDRDRDHDNDRH